MADRSGLGRQLRPPTLHWGKLLRPSVTTIKCYHTGPQILRLHQANGHVSTLSHSLPKHRLGVAENTMVRSRANPLAQAPAPCLGLVSHLFRRKARDSSVRQLPHPRTWRMALRVKGAPSPSSCKFLNSSFVPPFMSHLLGLPGQGPL